MSEKTVISCDFGPGCCNEHEHYGGDFLLMDVMDIGWFYDEENETHYCPNHAKEVMKEMGVENQA